MANNDLKRVGLVFNADGSTNFVKSLKLVNSTLQENYQDFKLVQAQWDKSTSTSQKLTDKLNYLNNAYDIQKEKVLILRKELKELEDAENKDEVAIQKKKTALASAEASLQRYKNQVDETSKKIKIGTANLEDFSKKLNTTGDKLVDTGKKMSAVSAGIAVAGTAIVKTAVDFESAWTGVTKTVNGTVEQLEIIKQGLLDLSQETASSAVEIAAVAEAAGQLGIKTEDILSFTKTMVQLGDSTNLSADEAASSLAKFANVMGTASTNYDKLGSTIVELGNNFATTEADIVAMATRLSGAGATIGLSEANVLSLATALSSVGIEAEMGGSAMSKAMVDMALAVETGAGKYGSLESYAQVANMTTKEFADTMKNDAITAISAFIIGLGDTEKTGKSTLQLLTELGFEEVRLRDTMLRATNASEVFTNAIQTGNIAWDENVALSNEAEKRYATTQSQITQLSNAVNELCVKLGEILLPVVQGIVDKLTGFVNWLSTLNPELQKTILIIAGLVAAIGPLLIVFGTLAKSISSIITMYTTYIAPMLAGVSTALSSVIAPILAVVAIIALVVLAIKQLWDTNEQFRTSVMTAIDGFIGTLQNFWDNILSPIIGVIKDTITTIWTDAIEPLWNNFVGFVGAIITELLKLWETFKPVLDKIIELLGPIITAVITTLGAKFSSVFTFISGVLTTAMNAVKNVVTGMIKVIRGIIDFLVGVFTGDWKKAWEGVKTIFSGIFQSLSSIVKAPLNLIISAINGLISGLNVFIKGLNKIEIPDWVPGVGGKGLNIKTIGTIDYLAKGGELLSGSAVVAEAGPELLLQQGNKTKVMPLTNGGGATPTQIIDYNKMTNSFIKALNSCKFTLDEDGFVGIVQEELLRVM